MIPTLLFWILCLLLLHSYLLFPGILYFLGKGKVEEGPVYTRPEELPEISILMSVFNEQKVIREKVHSLLNTSYPSEKIQILIGSDNSTDRTNEILEEIAGENPAINLTFFSERQGKGNIINQLVRKSKGEILIITDANVIIQRNTLFELVKHFKDPSVGIVDSVMLNTGIKKDGISFQEMAYISREVRIKHREGLLWGAMMGPFGGCYAFRKELFSPIPSTILVDDFYINMLVLERNYRSISEPQARVYEDVSNDLAEEFRRKVRIAAGNFQNLSRFRKLLLPLFKGRSFVFFSHKILRWFGPFILSFAFILNLFIYGRHPVYQISLWIQAFLILLPFLDYLLRKFGIHIVLLRFITHFYAMNLALMLGFFKTLKGIHTNVWQPTRRYQ